MTCYDQAGESIVERWVKVGIRVFARIYEALSRIASIHLGNPGLAPQVVHHAAGGYPDVMDAKGISTMMNDFLTAFPDLRYRFDQFIVRDNHVVERYTATGTQQGQLGDLPPSGRRATWTGINIFRIECGRIAEVWSEVDAVSRRQQLTGAQPTNSAQ